MNKGGVNAVADGGIRNFVEPVTSWRNQRNPLSILTCDIKLKVNYFLKSTNHQKLWSAIFLKGRFVHSGYLENSVALICCR